MTRVIWFEQKANFHTFGGYLQGHIALLEIGTF